MSESELPYVAQWARAFVVTFAMELPFVLILAKKAEPKVWRRLVLALFAQIFTHPAVWFIFPELGLESVPELISCEAWAFIGEAIFYTVVFPPIGWKRATVMAFSANYASLVFGLYLREWTGLV